jgi:hypothetical protein
VVNRQPRSGDGLVDLLGDGPEPVVGLTNLILDDFAMRELTARRGRPRGQHEWPRSLAAAVGVSRGTMVACFEAPSTFRPGD